MANYDAMRTAPSTRKYTKKKQALIKGLKEIVASVMSAYVRDLYEAFDTAVSADCTPGTLMYTAHQVMEGKLNHLLDSKVRARVTLVFRKYFGLLGVTDVTAFQFHEKTKHGRNERTKLILPMKTWNSKLFKNFGVMPDSHISFELLQLLRHASKGSIHIGEDYTVWLPLAGALDTDDLVPFANLFRAHWKKSYALAKARISVGSHEHLEPLTTSKPERAPAPPFVH